jgi:hypothetical protein
VPQFVIRISFHCPRFNPTFFWKCRHLWLSFARLAILDREWRRMCRWQGHNQIARATGHRRQQRQRSAQRALLLSGVCAAPSSTASAADINRQSPGGSPDSARLTGCCFLSVYSSPHILIHTFCPVQAGILKHSFVPSDHLDWLHILVDLPSPMQAGIHKYSFVHPDWLLRPDVGGHPLLHNDGFVISLSRLHDTLEGNSASNGFPKGQPTCGCK